MNEAIFFAINSLAGSSPVLDKLMVFAAQPLLPIIIVAAFILVIRIVKKAIISLIFTIILVILIDKTINIFLPTERPFVERTITLLTNRVADSSFPSLHAALAMATATFVFFNTRLVGTVLILGAILVGLGRVYVGVHWPIDVLGGFIIGFLVAYFVKKAFTIVETVGFFEKIKSKS